MSLLYGTVIQLYSCFLNSPLHVQIQLLKKNDCFVLITFSHTFCCFIPKTFQSFKRPWESCVEATSGGIILHLLFWVNQIKLCFIILAMETFK